MAYICNVCGKLYFPSKNPRGKLSVPLIDSPHGVDNLVEIDDGFAAQLQKMHWYKELWRKKKLAAAGVKRRLKKRRNTK